MTDGQTYNRACGLRNWRDVVRAWDRYDRRTLNRFSLGVAGKTLASVYSATYADYHAPTASAFKTKPTICR